MNVDLLAVVVVGALMVLLSTSGCQSNTPAAVEKRGSIISADGVVLAYSEEAGSGWARIYPEGDLARVLIGSRYAQEESSEGIENIYASDLEAGSDVMLTISSAAQVAAEEALGDYSGAFVVLDANSGAVIACASQSDNDGENQALHLRIPGSTFKTVTLSAALRAGVTIDEYFGAPASLVVDGGTVNNYGDAKYGEISLHEAYAKSVNTVFAQLSLNLGVEALLEESRLFGFDTQVSQDLPCEISTIQHADNLSPLARAWCGVGQALYQDGDTVGPLITPLHLAAISAVFVNGGTLYSPYAVAWVGSSAGLDEGEESQGESEGLQGTNEGQNKKILNESFIASEHLQQISDAMREVVSSGTGTNAKIDGFDVGGKTGMAETSDKTDAWFSGFATKGERSIAFCVLINDAESSDAAACAAQAIPHIFDVWDS